MGIVVPALLALSAGAAGVVIGRATADPSGTARGMASASETSGPDATAAADLVEQGLAAHVAGQLEDATALYRRALSLDPRNKFAYFNIGQIAQTSNQLPAAIAAYKGCLTIDSAYVPALFNLGLAYLSLNDAKNAVDVLSRARDASPKDAKILFSLGKALVADGKSDEGAKLVATAVSLEPALTDAH